MKFRHIDPVPVAAARAGFSAATGYRLLEDPRPPSQRQATRGRRRPDPLADIFEAEIIPLLTASPGLAAGLQDALSSLGGSPHEHRSDSLRIRLHDDRPGFDIERPGQRERSIVVHDGGRCVEQQPASDGGLGDGYESSAGGENGDTGAAARDTTAPV